VEKIKTMRKKLLADVINASVLKLRRKLSVVFTLRVDIALPCLMVIHSAKFTNRGNIQYSNTIHYVLTIKKSQDF